MKPRHAAALALVGWCLGVTVGKAMPKGCSHCGVTMEIEQHDCVRKFKTEARCRVAADEYVQDYYVKADKSGELVVESPAARCTEVGN